MLKGQVTRYLGINTSRMLKALLSSYLGLAEVVARSSMHWAEVEQPSWLSVRYGLHLSPIHGSYIVL